MNKLLPLLLISALLAGCGGETSTDTDTDTGPVEQDDASLAAPTEEASPVDPLAMARNDPDSLREAMNDPAQREALIQSMRERRGRMDDEGRRASREELRERMRERRAEMGREEGVESRRAGLRERQLPGAAAWWEDPDFSEQLKLSETQLERIESANSEREAQLAASRNTLAEAQTGLMQALRGGERDQIDSLLVERHAAMSALSEAELNWQRQLLETLSDEQLSELINQNPQVLIGRHRPM